jgi:hypothetical protein
VAVELFVRSVEHVCGPLNARGDEDPCGVQDRLGLEDSVL